MGAILIEPMYGDCTRVGEELTDKTGLWLESETCTFYLMTFIISP